MAHEVKKSGYQELRDMRRKSGVLYAWVALFSCVVNILVLSGPLYMLQVYDRVLGSGSIETLVALSILLTGLYASLGVLDGARMRVTARIGARFFAGLEERVFQAELDARLKMPQGPQARGIANLDAVRKVMISPALTALFDLPWVPFFFLVIFILHPVMGFVAVAGGLALIAIAGVQQLLSVRLQASALHAGVQAERRSVEINENTEVIAALGMNTAARAYWQMAQAKYERSTLRALDIGGDLGALTRALRLFLQSAMLGCGAWLVIGGQMTAGGMIAGSILLGRALAPLEILIAQWPVVQRGRQGWNALAQLLGQMPAPPLRITLPRPKATVQAQSVTVFPPGERRAVLRNLSFTVEPGAAVGVIGPSGAGKSAFARTMTGVWPVSGGRLSLDGVLLEHYGPDILGRYIGYLPQRVSMFETTIADNIARLTSPRDDAKVIAAARSAAAHDMITALPQGYDTILTGASGALSGGQLQRIGLARALYNDPQVVVLDEPNANLDGVGSAALNTAIRTLKAADKTVFIMAHRPAAIQECDLLLVLEDGVQVAFGRKSDVLPRTLKNAAAIQTANHSVAGAA